jgi:hypothetical protein
MAAWKDALYVDVRNGAMRYANGRWAQVGEPIPGHALAQDGGRPYPYYEDASKGPTVLISE